MRIGGNKGDIIGRQFAKHTGEDQSQFVISRGKKGFIDGPATSSVESKVTAVVSSNVGGARVSSLLCPESYIPLPG